MAGHDLLHYFLLHEAPRPIADCTFLIGKKFFDAVVIQRGRRHVSSRSTSGGVISVSPSYRGYCLAFSDAVPAASFWKRESFRIGSNIGSSLSSAEVSGALEASGPPVGIESSLLP